ncbi:hypothetical protein C1N61_28060 (plasmid) [Priestia aryabhattai]
MKNIVKNLELIVKNNTTKVPMRSTDGSAGFDVFSSRKLVLPSKTVVCINLPFNFVGELTEELEIRLFARSSFGIKKKLRLVHKYNKDIDYLTLNVKDKNHVINVINDGEEDLVINSGEHFAQFIFCEKEPKPEEMKLLTVPAEEMQKHTVLESSIKETNPYFFEYTIEEELVFAPGEQKVYATGYRSLINENTWTAVKIHKDVKGKLILANQTGVIDRDYAFTGNYGHCFVALVNLTNENLKISKGTKLMTWSTEKYYVLENEVKSNNKRLGGIGSTN